MNAELLKSVGINYDEGVKRFSGKKVLYEKFLRKFTEDDNFDSLREELQKGNLDAAFRNAHALKGITGNLSMNKFYKKLNGVVEALRGRDEAKAKKLFAELDKEYEMHLRAIEESDE